MYVSICKLGNKWLEQLLLQLQLPVDQLLRGPVSDVLHLIQHLNSRPHRE